MPNFVRRELISLFKIFHCKCQALGAGIAVTQRIVHGTFGAEAAESAKSATVRRGSRKKPLS